jgi:hypothetical protein
MQGNHPVRLVPNLRTILPQPVPVGAAVKRSRTARTRRGLPPIGERDLDILTLVGLCRFLTTPQVARDLFPTEDRARRRLRQLFDAKLIAVTLTSSTQPNLISLTREGHEMLKAHRPELAARIRRTGLIRLGELERHLLLVDARLYAAAWGEAQAAPLIRWTNNPAPSQPLRSAATGRTKEGMGSSGSACKWRRGRSGPYGC